MGKKVICPECGKPYETLEDHPLKEDLEKCFECARKDKPSKNRRRFGERYFKNQKP